MSDNNKRLYSLNDVAYIMAVTDLMPQMHLDKQSDTYFFQFTPCQGVETAIKEYKNGTAVVNVQSFLRCIKLLRKSISIAKEGEMDL